MKFDRRRLLRLGGATACVAGFPRLAASASTALNVGFVNVGSASDGGWTLAHDVACKGLQRKFGDRIKTTFVENVNEGPDGERVFRDLVSRGNRLIFGTSFGYGPAMQSVASDNPGVFFEHATGYRTLANLRVYEGKFFEETYIAGILAAHASKSGQLGFVGAFPIPEVLRNLNAFVLGAQTVNPNILLRVVWLSTWFDPSKEVEGAQSLIDQGCDVLIQATDSTAVLQTAAKHGKFAFGWNSDMKAVAPKAHLASCVFLWQAYYEKSVNEVLTDTWRTGATIWGTKEGMNDIVSLANFLPEAAKAKAAEIRAGLKSGSFEVFKGPITDSSGKQVLASGAVADTAWKANMNFYVTGVQGSLPR